MADQKRWWKMWTSILTDDAILSLPLDDRWRWVALGCYITEHGERGRLVISPKSHALAFIFCVSSDEVLSVLKRLPNITVDSVKNSTNEEGKNRDANICVTFVNWHKYQIDSTAAIRMKTLRLKRRGEEKRYIKTKDKGFAPQNRGAGFFQSSTKNNTQPKPSEANESRESQIDLLTSRWMSWQMREIFNQTIAPAALRSQIQAEIARLGIEKARMIFDSHVDSYDPNPLGLWKKIREAGNDQKTL
ncbi:hypothetical protein L0152_32105 [bacterium]|nr:hypothetical protein [bacterium]